MNLKKLKQAVHFCYLVIYQRVLQHLAMQRVLHGSYRCETRDGARMIYETVVLTRISAVSGLFRIEKITSSEETEGPRLITTESGRESWFGAYNHESHQINEINNGRQISFIPEENLLIIGKQAYKQLPAQR